MEQFRFQDTLEIMCNYFGMGLGTAQLEVCFSWHTNGQNEDCDEEFVDPGLVSKCDCSLLDLGIAISSSEAPSKCSSPSLSSKTSVSSAAPDYSSGQCMQDAW